MADRSPSPSRDLSASGLTIPSDSEPYSSLSPPSSSPPQSSSNNNGEQPVIIYQPPTVWSILRGAAINLLLPFVNGLMLGFGELLAHEFAFRVGWSSTNVWPRHRSSHAIGPGVEMREDPIERRRRQSEFDPDLVDAASLE
ncbi:Mitochondrial import protein 1 [Cyphellophora attinorum]|uniref:Mitochondrial import protein 1 n=1 Tax=Cyphellophora attinorum TaxID=1664694 RepID=A0A0N1H7X5_9EURO|nr:Mitochondrial import protein 1 [Phialophora attinorum]KPI37846.1 Mitochondrial import protein 1 [Phialophora attinorum]